MPLQYDDKDGSWGPQSINWPRFTVDTLPDLKNPLNRAFVACGLEGVVPYGSYVMHNAFIAIETPELLGKLITHLSNTQLTYDEVIDIYSRKTKTLEQVLASKDRNTAQAFAYKQAYGGENVSNQ